jgi:hypothetical protein
VSAKKSSPSATEPLACPSCALRHSLEERFCASCGMPLVYVGGDPLDEPVSDAHGRARKIDPRYTEGPLVPVAGGRNQAEAELIQGLLLEEGVPSVLRRSAGFDVPDFLAAGPRDVMVPEAGAQAAREVLLTTDLAPAEPSGAAAPHPGRLAVAVLGGGALTALIAWGLLQLSS